VARILVDPQSRLASGVVLRSGDILPADVVVSCVDVHHTETSLLPEEFRFFPESSWGRFVPSPSSLIVMVGVKKGLPQLAHHNLFFPRNWDRTLASLGSGSIDDPFASEYLYVGRPTATDPSAAPKGKESLVLIAPLPADPTLGATDESRQALTDLAACLLGQVEVLAAIPELTKRSHILEVVTPADLEREYSTWRGSGFGLAPTLRGLTLGRPGSASRRARNLLYAGSSMLPGVGVPGALASAELVAKSLLGQNDPTPLPVPVGRGFLFQSRRRDALGDLLRTSAVEEAPGPD
jgi:phytoene desaturase